MRRALCLAIVAALFVGCGDRDSDDESVVDIEETKDEVIDLLDREGITDDDIRDRANWLQGLPEDERAVVVREDFQFGLSMAGASSPLEDWSNDQIIEFARRVCEAMGGAANQDQYAMSLAVIAAGYDLNTYEDQVAAGMLSGAAAAGWCFDDAERLGMVDAMLGAAPDTSFPASELEFDETASAGELDQVEAEWLRMGGATDEQLACVADRLTAEQISFDYLTDDPPDYGDGFDAAFTAYADAVADCLPPEVDQAILADPIPGDCLSEALASFGLPYSDFLRWLASSNPAQEFPELDAAIEACG